MPAVPIPNLLLPRQTGLEDDWRKTRPTGVERSRHKWTIETEGEGINAETKRQGRVLRCVVARGKHLRRDCKGRTAGLRVRVGGRGRMGGVGLGATRVGWGKVCRSFVHKFVIEKHSIVISRACTH